MFLFYVFEDDCNWVFWDSVPWDQFKPELLDSICLDVDEYVKRHPIFNERGDLIYDIVHPIINHARFIHDMILYKEYKTTRLSIYYVNMPR